jgi:Flp pilus assembly protein TadG
MIPTPFEFLRRRDGAQAVEFAIIFPLIIATFLGTFEIGRMLYNRNRIAAATEEGVRAVSMYGANGDTSVTSAIRNKLSDIPTAQLQVALTNQTLGGAAFKKIEVTYTHNFIIKFKAGWNGVTIKATRYAPALH